MWDNNLVQFARLLSEIIATQDNLDINLLCESMDLEKEDINELFNRACEVWEDIKINSLMYNAPITGFLDRLPKPAK